MAEYAIASDELIEIAEQIISDHHHHLHNAEIGFIFRDFAAKRNRRLIFGKAKKAPKSLQPLFQDLDFIIEIAKDVWDKLRPDQRRALIDHELCHCDYSDEKGGFVMRGHDIEEFAEIIERHGLWVDGLINFFRPIHTVIQREFQGMEISSGGRVVKVDAATMKQMSTQGD